MAGIRGVVNPMPSKGKAPSGMFSTNGAQKLDSTSCFTGKDLKSYALDNTSSMVKPVKRDNRIKKG